MTEKSRDTIAVAALTAAIGVSVALVGSLPKYPLDDSFSYFLVLKNFLATGRPEYDTYTSAASLLQLFLSAPFALVGGVRFESAVVYNLVVTWLCVLAMYRLGRAAGARAGSSFGAALVFFTAPPVFINAFTYRCDTIFTLAVILAMTSVAGFIKRKDSGALLRGGIFAALSIWGKIHGVLIAPGIAAALALHPKTRKKMATRDWVNLLVPTVISFVLFQAAKPIVHPVSKTLDRKWGEFFDRLFSAQVVFVDGGYRITQTLILVAFFALPLLAALRFAPGSLYRNATLMRKLWAPTAAAMTFVVAAAVCFSEWRHGASHALISSVLTEPPTMEPMGLYGRLYYGALIALGFFLFLLVRKKEADAVSAENGEILLLGAAVVIPQMLLLIPIEYFMDRYFIAILPGFLLVTLAAAEDRKARLWILVPLAVLFLALDVTRMIQYRNGCAAQWEAADRIVSENNVRTFDVDGGYAWVGTKNYPNCDALDPRAASADRSGRDYRTPWVMQLCPAMDPKWFVTFYEPGEGDGRVIEKTIPYDAGPLLGQRDVYVLKTGEGQF